MNQLKQFQYFLYPQISSLLLYPSVFHDKVSKTFISLSNHLYFRDKQTFDVEFLKNYGNFFKALARTGKS